MRLPIDTSAIKFAAAGPVELVRPRNVHDTEYGAEGRGIEHSLGREPKSTPHNQRSLRVRTRSSQTGAVASGESVQGHRGVFDRALSVNEVAVQLGTSTATVRRLMAHGELSFQRVSSRRTIIRESTLLAYLARVTVQSR